MNVKRLSKRSLATLLSALLLLSTIVTGSVATANAAGSFSYSSGDFFVYFNAVSLSDWAKNNIRFVAVTDNEIYISQKFDSVSNTSTSLRYKNVKSDFSGLTWSNVNEVLFVDYSDSDNPTHFTYGDGGTYAFVDAFLTAKTAHHTAVYSGGFTVNPSNNRLLFAPTSNDSSLSMISSGNSYSVMNFAQAFSGVNGTAAVTSYYTMTVADKANSKTGDAITDPQNVSAACASQITVSATPADAGCIWDGWYDGATKVSTANPYTYTVEGAKTLTAKFISGGFAQTVSAGDGGGTVSVSGGGNSGTSIVVPSGTSVTYTAIPAANYRFDGWYGYDDFSGGVVSTSDPYTFTATSVNTLYARFTLTTDSGEDDPSQIPTSPAVKNTGSRHINSTALSSQAITYYTDEVKTYITDSNVYDTFVDLQDNNPDNGSGTSYDAMQNNDLFNTLYNIMSTTHTHGVSYPSYGKNSLAHHWLTTDTSYDNVNDGRGVYTFFYEDTDCYNHDAMQREHIWPKSKASFLMKTGLGGSDLHHLRPAYGKVNNIKSNWGFGSLHNWNSTYFKSGCTHTKKVNWPTDTTSLWRADVVGSDSKTRTYIDVRDDVRGDVARILLYVYTRWKQPNLYSDITTIDDEGNTVPDTSKLPELDPDDSKDTGERIIQSKEVLLDWMKNDPVSEWEMQRNDYTQKIQGNRNVFIDYPELAWMLFDENVPGDMDTPSGMARQTGTDIGKTPDTVFTDGVVLDFNEITNNGVAEITAYDVTTGKAVKNGDTVERGDIITYTISPDESTISAIREFNSDANSGSGVVRTIVEPNQDTTYSFSKQAGYYNGSPNTGYAKDRIKVTLNSKVCELNIKINSKTATGGTGGSGSGMVTARITGTNTVLENGASVLNGTSVTFYFTPDYGSRFFGLTYVNTQEAVNITGTDTYTYTTTLDCASNNSARKKTFTVYFAQTFNAGASDPNKHKHINNKGMRPDAADEWGAETDFTENFEICGVQIKHFDGDKENKALRFISVIDQKILDKAESYGYVIGYTKKNLDRKTINRYAYALVKDGDSGITLDCTDTDNEVFGDYGKHDTTKNYKYVTAAVNNLQEAGNEAGLDANIIARPYVVLKSEYRADGCPSVIYGQYVDVSTGENYCSCSGSYNYIAQLESEE